MKGVTSRRTDLSFAPQRRRARSKSFRKTRPCSCCPIASRHARPLVVIVVTSNLASELGLNAFVLRSARRGTGPCDVEEESVKEIYSIVRSSWIVQGGTCFNAEHEPSAIGGVQLVQKYTFSGTSILSPLRLSSGITSVPVHVSLHSHLREAGFRRVFTHKCKFNVSFVKTIRRIHRNGRDYRHPSRQISHHIQDASTKVSRRSFCEFLSFLD